MLSLTIQEAALTNNNYKSLITHMLGLTFVSTTSRTNIKENQIMKTILYTLSIVIFLTSFFQMNETMAQQNKFQHNTNDLNIYPNPVASGQELKIELGMNNHQVVNFYVYDFAGKLVKESTLHRLGFGEQVIILNMEITEKGIYFVKVVIEDELTSSKKSKVNKLYVI